MMSEIQKKEKTMRYFHIKSLANMAALAYYFAMCWDATRSQKSQKTMNMHWRNVFNCCMKAFTIHPHQKSMKRKPGRCVFQRIDSFHLKAHPGCLFWHANFFFWEMCVPRVFRASLSTLELFRPRWDVVRWRCRYNQDLMKNVRQPEPQRFSKWTFCIIFIW